MTILYIYHDYYGRRKGYADCLRKLGHNVKVVTIKERMMEIITK